MATKTLEGLGFRYKDYYVIVYFCKKAYYESLDKETRTQLEKVYGAKVRRTNTFTPAHSEGMADLDTNEIKLLIHPQTGRFAAEKLIAHEVGHLIKETHKRDAPYNKANIKHHEAKANHYENFHETVVNIAEKIYLHL